MHQSNKKSSSAGVYISSKKYSLLCVLYCIGLLLWEARPLTFSNLVNIKDSTSVHL